MVFAGKDNKSSDRYNIEFFFLNIFSKFITERKPITFNKITFIPNLNKIVVGGDGAGKHNTTGCKGTGKYRYHYGLQSQTEITEVWIHKENYIFTLGGFYEAYEQDQQSASN